MKTKTQILLQALCLCLALCGFTQFSFAQLSVTGNTNADALVSTLLGPGIQFDNASLTSAGNSVGTFSNGSSTNIGLDNGVLLTTGDIANAPGPNDEDNASANNNAPGSFFIPNSNDATVLRFTFEPDGSRLQFRYVFASDEYPEFFCREFNDQFGFFLSGPNPNGGNYSSTNLALLPDGNTVAINNVGPGSCGGVNNSDLYIDNTGGTSIEYDGFTTVLTVEADIVPCEEYSIQLVIADVQDFVWDSGVFLEEGSFTSLPPVPDYFFVDADGNPRTEFCPGEDVFIDGSASQGGSHWFLSIWQYNIGGLAAGEDNLAYCKKVPTWTAGPVEVEHLNPIWDNCDENTAEFPPGFEYRVQLALTTPCGGWYPKEDEVFIVQEELTADYIFVDAAGNPREVFCYGEDVFIDGTGSESEDAFFLSIWQYNIGGLAAGESSLEYCRKVPDWTWEEVGVEHLNPIWDACGNSPFFLPGFEYRVQLAVRNECDNWVAKEDMVFLVECCDSTRLEFETCFAKFDLDSDEMPDGSIVHTTSGVLSNDFPYESSLWFLYSHENFGSGPYTPVESGEGPDYEFTTQLEPASCYTLVHKVITPCGECCYAREICHSGGGLLRHDDPGTGIDCETIQDEFCKALEPANLSCRQVGAFVSLSWDPVPLAQGYTVSITQNDPDCCHTSETPITNFYDVTNSVVTVYLPTGTCYSWEVVAICPNGSLSPPAQACGTSPCSSPDGGGESDGEGDGRFGHNHGGQQQANTSKIEGQIVDAQLQVFPNPASNVVNFDITTAQASQEVTIKVYDLNARLITTITNFSNDGNQIFGKWIPTSEVKNGIYLIEVTLDHTVIAEKVLLMK